MGRAPQAPDDEDNKETGMKKVEIFFFTNFDNDVKGTNTDENDDVKAP